MGLLVSALDSILTCTKAIGYLGFENFTLINKVNSKRLEKVSPGNNKSGNLLLKATAAAVTIFVEPGPTEEVAIKICFLLIALA